MKPEIIQLPDIYRGSLYPVIFMYWKNKGGGVANLNGWIPLCYAKEFSFNAAVVNYNTGQTRIVLNQVFTRDLRLGRQSWDFLWVNAGFVYPPVLSGVVTVREPLSNTDIPVPPIDTAPDGPVTS